MFVGMGVGLTIDQRQQRIIAEELLIATIRADQIEELEEFDQAQVATGDGFRSLSEWTGAVLDLSSETAKSLVRTMRRTTDRPELREALSSGEVSFDRVEALSRIPEDVGLLEQLDVARSPPGGRQSGPDHRRDRVALLERPVPGPPTVPGRIVVETMGWSRRSLRSTRRQSPGRSCGCSPRSTRRESRGDAGWRRATALTQLCVSDDPPPVQVTVFIDAQHAVPTNGEAGVVLETGPRVGRQALQGLLCESVTEITVTGEDGTPMSYGTENPSPSLRHYAGRSSTATATGAPPTTVRADTDSKSTIASPGPKAEPPTPTI